MILRHLSIDCVIFGFKDNKLCVLLWQSDSEVARRFFAEKDNFEDVEVLYSENPMHLGQDYWGLIGSHLPAEEDIDEYAKFILSKSTGLENVYLNQVKTFGKVERVPFKRVLTTAYYAIINPEYHDLRQSEMAKVLNWFEIDKLPKLVFDHKMIINEALKKLRDEVKYHPVGFQMLPDKFTLTELQTLYEGLLNTTLDTRNFRKKIQNMGLLVDTGEKQTNVAHRAAKLYAFDLDVYNKLKEEGLNFRI
ncbi:NUDIX hydrolase [Draconibacterium halophilum]|uniref:NUDIX hydrolase n=1 Tax=Draconibacterium halophilum TaxID=2706887 RepID=A0A6C0RCL9_9BACT|nr:NUDIX hydrolase [Draconibacterium halophilum]QIA07776.1 NUDIX hydrolase [Draconibacterium halophilum]